MAKPKLSFSPIQLRLASQQRVIPLGLLSNVLVDFNRVCSLDDFKVIEIIDDSVSYPVLLGIDWAFYNQEIINLKRRPCNSKVMEFGLLAH